MKQFYHSGRAASLLAFVLFTSAALAILLHDWWSGKSAFELKHYQTIVVLAGTILVGHLAKKAGWLSLSKYGFASLFVVGTVLVAYSSIGRQTEALTVTAERAESEAEQRSQAKADKKANEAMLATAKKELAIECKSGAGKRCAGIERTIAVYTAAVAGNQATLERLGPAKPVTPEADAFANFAAAFEYDRDRAKAKAVLIQPFATFAFLEFGSIVSLGFVLAGGQKKRAAAPQLQPSSPSKSDAVMVVEPPVSVKDSEQSDFQLPPAREHKALIAAGLLCQDGAVPKSPDRWSYKKDLN